jgi:excisionase family DNA binding protein
MAYGVKDVAKVLGIGRTNAFRLIKEGHLKAVKIGGRTLVTVREIEAYLTRLSEAVA